MKTKKKPKYNEIYATNDQKQIVITTKEQMCIRDRDNDGENGRKQ